MRLTAETLLYKLKDLEPLCIHIPKGQFEFDGVKMYRFYEDNYFTNYFYVVNLSYLFNKKDCINPNIIYLVINDIDMNIDTIKNCNFKIILINGQYELTYVFNYILNMYDILNTWDKNMHIAALEGTSPQEMIDLSESIIEFPMLIFDTSFNVLAYTRHINCDYDLFNETIVNGYTSYKIIKTLKLNNVFKQLTDNSEPVIGNSADSPNYNNLYIKISYDHTLFGYSCLGHTKFNLEQGYVDLMKHLSKNLVLYFKRNYKDQRFGDLMYETFLINLINNKDKIMDKIYDQIHYIDGLTISGIFKLGLVVLNKQDNVPMPYISSVISRAFTSIRPFIYDNNLVLLKSGDTCFLTQQELKDLDTILKPYKYTLGISKQFSNITDIYVALIQCQKALQYGLEYKTNKKMFIYEEFYYYHILENIANEVPLTSLLSDAYIELKKYAIETKSNWLPLLKSYLKNGCNITQTSKDTFMHRNTVIHNIKKMEDIFNISFENFYLRQDFLISFAIEEYIKIRK